MTRKFTIFIMFISAMALCSCSDNDEQPNEVDTLTINVPDNKVVLVRGTTFTVQTTTSPAGDARIEYLGGDPLIAAIDDKGVISSDSSGITIYTIRASKGVTRVEKDLWVYVNERLTTLEVRTGCEYMQINVGQKVDGSTGFRILPVPFHPNVKYESLNPAIASVDDETGAITGVSAGTAKIKASSLDGTDLESGTLDLIVAATGTETPGPIAKTGWTASAPSQYSASYSPAKVIDGVINGTYSYWRASDGTTGTLPQWFMIDMKAVKSFRKLEIFRSTLANRGTREIEIWFSNKDEDGVVNDDSSFTKAGTVTFDTNKKTENKVGYSSYPNITSARYIKLMLNSRFDKSPITLDEVNVYE